MNGRAAWKRIHKRSSLGLGLFVLTLALAGCVDLAEVVKFAGISQTANQSFPGLVADMKDSCLRFNSYVPKNEMHQDCSKYDKTAPGLLAAQAVLIDYMEALGKLGSNESVTFGKNLGALPGKFAEAGLDAAQAKAATSLAAKLANLAIKGYRKHEIRKLVRAENGDIKTLTAALAKLIGNDYDQLLKNESEAMRDHFETLLHEYGAKEPLAAELVKRAWAADQKDLDARRKAAGAYARIMSSIADGHNKLAEHSASFSAKELIQDLGPEIEDIANAANDVRKAFQ